MDGQTAMELAMDVDMDLQSPMDGQTTKELLIGVDPPLPMTVVELSPRWKCCVGEGTSYKKWDLTVEMC